MSGIIKTPGKSVEPQSDTHDLLESNSNIALKLRELYNSVETQPLPDVFLDLLEKLDVAEKMVDPET